MSLKERLRGVVAAVATAVLALSVAPVTAMADPGDVWTGTQTGQIVVTGQGIDSNTVHVYKVADITLDSATNVTTLQPVTGLESVVNAWKESSSATNAAAIAQAATGLIDLTTAGVTVTPSASGVTISPVTAGVYLIQIDDNTTTATAYQNIVVALEPTAMTDGRWTIGSKEISVKSSSTGLEKTIVSVDGLEGTGTGDDLVYEVGDVVKYKVSFSVGANMSEFYLDDTMSGLNFNDDVEVYVGHTVLTPGMDYSVVNTGLPTGVTFRVVFTEAGIAAAGGQDNVYMTYSGTITDAATVATGADNTVTSSVNPTGSTVDLSFAGLKVYKYKDDNENEALQGAVFGLYADEECTNLIESATTNENGVATFNALLSSSNTYYVKEISAPSGYQLSETVYAVGAGQTITLTDDAYVKVDVPNTPSGTDQGIDLPQTGGPGTIALTVAGAALVAGAAVWAVRSRKEN